MDIKDEERADLIDALNAIIEPAVGSRVVERCADAALQVCRHHQAGRARVLHGNMRGLPEIKAPELVPEVNTGPTPPEPKRAAPPSRFYDSLHTLLIGKR